jgi:hypothetical protein
MVGQAITVPGRASLKPPRSWLSRKAGAPFDARFSHRSPTDQIFLHGVGDADARLAAPMRDDSV